MLHDKDLTPEQRASAERTFANVIAWTTLHGLTPSPEKVDLLGDALAETMPLLPPTGEPERDALRLFVTSLVAIDRVWGNPSAANPGRWKATLAGLGAEALDMELIRGGYKAPSEDELVKMGRAVARRAAGLVSQAHRFDPETAAQKMREHVTAIVDVYLGPAPRRQLLN